MYELRNLEKMLDFIEDEENYYAGFGKVVQSCHAARECKTHLWDTGVIDDNENLAISERISAAYRSAIETHRQWVINFYKDRDLSAHTVESFITTIYNDIFN